jgi:UDP-glucose 4-epimerase
VEDWRPRQPGAYGWRGNTAGRFSIAEGNRYVRVLVTGGFGFLGRAVVSDLLQRGHHVVALSREARGGELPTVEVVQADLRDREALMAAVEPLKVEAVCHLAARTSVRESFADPLGYFDVNVGGSLNLLRAVRPGSEARPVRFVFISTNAVYGSARSGLLSEDVAPSPENPYAATKTAVEQLLTYSAQADSSTFGAVTLRCFNIAGGAYGHGDRDSTRIIPAALNVAAGKSAHVRINGDGSAVREFTHVLDVAAAVSLALTNTRLGTHQILNVGTGLGFTMLDVIRAVEGTTGRPVPVVHAPSAREAHTLVADGRHIREVLGWQPTHSSIEAIVRDAWEVVRR